MAWTAANSTAVFVKYGGCRNRDRNATVAVIIYIDNDVRFLFSVLLQNDDAFSVDHLQLTSFLVFWYPHMKSAGTPNIICHCPYIPSGHGLHDVQVFGSYRTMQKISN